MSQRKNQAVEPTGLIGGISQEVSPESAPLLLFVTRHAGTIAGVVVLLLLVLGGMAIWNWYQASKLRELNDELARITTTLTGAERESALAALAEKAPDNSRVFIYMNLGQNAIANGEPAKAADAYAKAASLDPGGALGLAAGLGNAGAQLNAGNYAVAVDILRGLEAKYPDSAAVRQTLAEAATAAGQLELAVSSYEKLAASLEGLDAAYFKARAEALKAQKDAGKK